MSVMDMVTTEPTIEELEPKKSKKTLVIGLVVVLVAAAAGWWFFLRSGDAEPKPGEMLELESIQVNLQGGHYLKIGIALQAVEGAEHVEGSKALDATIELFSGRNMAELGNRKTRERLKDKLTEELDERYHGEVMEVFFTDFVTQ